MLLQIETELSLANIEAIAAVKGVDAVFIGPSGLAAALGYIGRPDHPDVVAKIEGAIAKLRAPRKPVGILAMATDLAAHYRSLGCSFIAVGTDAALFSKTLSDLARLHRPSGETDTAVPQSGY